jgi:NAD(P) transhydrogenase subunit alpha
MKRDAVIMDVAIDQGGNCAATEPGEFVQKEGVHICGIQNIPGRMAVHAGWLYANNMFHYVANLFKNGVDTPDLDDEIARESLVTYQGKIVFEGALKAMGFHYVQ